MDIEDLEAEITSLRREMQNQINDLEERLDGLEDKVIEHEVE